MNIIKSEVIFIIVISLVNIFVFILSSIVQRLFPEKKEISRKTSHVFGGLVSLSIPFFTKNIIIVGFLCFVFLIVLIVSKRLKVLKGIHDIGRASFGAYLFPLAIFLMFFLAKDKPVLYVVSVLILTLSDAAAALIGKRYGSIKINIEGNLKSLEGSAAFFIFTFNLVLILLLLLTDFNKYQILLTSLIVSLVITGLELIALNGTDNLFIPLGTFFIIDRLSKYGLDVHFNTLFQLIFCVLFVLILFIKNKNLALGWKITNILFLFACISLSGVYFLIAGIIFIVFLFVLINFDKNYIDNFYDVKSGLSISFFPVIPVFLSAFFNDQMMFFPLFILFLLIELFFIFLNKLIKNKLKLSIIKYACSFIIGAAALILPEFLKNLLKIL